LINFLKAFRQKWSRIKTFLQQCASVQIWLSSLMYSIRTNLLYKFVF
jgi:hypothetical protein